MADRPLALRRLLASHRDHRANLLGGVCRRRARARRIGEPLRHGLGGRRLPPPSAPSAPVTVAASNVDSPAFKASRRVQSLWFDIRSLSLRPSSRGRPDATSRTRGTGDRPTQGPTPAFATNQSRHALRPARCARRRCYRRRNERLRQHAIALAIRSKDAAARTERLAARGVVVSWRTEDVPRGSWRHRGAGPHPTTANAGF